MGWRLWRTELARTSEGEAIRSCVLPIEGTLLYLEEGVGPYVPGTRVQTPNGGLTVSSVAINLRTSAVELTVQERSTALTVGDIRTMWGEDDLSRYPELAHLVTYPQVRYDPRWRSGRVRV